MLRKTSVLLSIILSILLISTAVYAYPIVFEFQGNIVDALDDGTPFTSEIESFAATITIDSDTPDSYPDDPAILGLYTPGVLELTLYNDSGGSFTTTNSNAKVIIQAHPFFDGELHTAANSSNFTPNSLPYDSLVDPILYGFVLNFVLPSGTFASDALPTDTIDYMPYILPLLPVAELQVGTSGYTKYLFDLTAASSSAAVPEPATMMLLGSGLIGLAGLGRKKLNK